MQYSQDLKSRQTQNKRYLTWTYFNANSVQKLIWSNFIFSYSKRVLVSELKPGKKYASFIKPIKPPYYFEKESDQAPRPVRVY